LTKTERMLAFSMRCDGHSYGEIAEVLHYDQRTIAKDLHAVLEKEAKVPPILFPALREYVRDKCEGSIETFAGQMRVSPHRLRRVLVHGDAPSEHLLNKITEITNLTREEIFENAVHLP